MDVERTESNAALSPEQQAALAKLHKAAQQLEGVFVGMLFKEMRKMQSETTLTGKLSEAEKTFGEMLDQERADSMAKAGTLGFAKIIESQLRDSVIGGAAPPSLPAIRPKAPRP